MYIYLFLFVCTFLFRFVGQMLGMERWMSEDKTVMVEDLLAKLKEDGLVPNIYTYNGVLLV